MVSTLQRAGSVEETTVVEENPAVDEAELPEVVDAGCPKQVAIAWRVKVKVKVVEEAAPLAPIVGEHKTSIVKEKAALARNVEEPEATPAVEERLQKEVLGWLNEVSVQAKALATPKPAVKVALKAKVVGRVAKKPLTKKKRLLRSHPRHLRRPLRLQFRGRSLPVRRISLL